MYQLKSLNRRQRVSWVTVLALAGLLAAGPANAAARPPGAPAAPAAVLAQPGNAFIEIGNVHNTLGEHTRFDNLALNGHNEARLFVTNQYQAEGSLSVRDPHATSLFYDSPSGQWEVFNADLAAMPSFPAWNVFVPPVDDTLIVHTSTVTNTPGAGLRTFIDNPLFNGQPNAILFVQHTANGGALAAADTPAAPQAPGVPEAPGGYTAITSTLTVAYDAGVGQWAIQRADGRPVDPHALFFVLKASPDETAFTHISTPANNLIPTGTELDNPLINDNPDAMLLISQNFGAGVTNHAHNHATGVFYNTVLKHWFIVNQDAAAMDAGVMFNVLVIPPKTGFQLQTAGPLSSYKSRLNNPELNGNPYARIYVTHNWNPPESNNHLFNDHPLGVFYDNGDQHWYLYNRDFDPLPVGATFNVYYTWPRGNSFTLSANHTNTDTLTGLVINSPLLNDTSSANAIVSYNKFPDAHFGADYTSQVGLLFGTEYGGDLFWVIYNNGGPAFPPGLSYNVLAPRSQSLHVTAINGPDSNFSGNDLIIDDPLTNNDPQALLFVSPRDLPATIDEHNLGVYYSAGRWGIFNEGDANILVGQAFNVFVIKRRSLYLPLTMR